MLKSQQHKLIKKMNYYTAVMFINSLKTIYNNGCEPSSLLFVLFISTTYNQYIHLHSYTYIPIILYTCIKCTKNVLYTNISKLHLNATGSVLVQIKHKKLTKFMHSNLSKDLTYKKI